MLTTINLKGVCLEAQKKLVFYFPVKVYSGVLIRPAIVLKTKN